MRRRFLTGAAASLVLPSIGAAEVPAPLGPRVAVLARWMVETVLALGVTPVAIPELSRNPVWRGLGLQGSIDLGLIGEPNLELLDQLRLDYIFIEAGFQSARWTPILGEIAPVVVGSIYNRSLAPLNAARVESRRFGELLTVEDRADALLADTAAALETAAAMPLARTPPVFVVRLLDDRNVILFCGGSIFDDVLKAVGIRNACSLSSMWGFLSNGIEALAAVPDAHLIYFDPVPPEARVLFDKPSLWSHLPAVKAGRVTAIPELYSWGALPTARLFAEILVERLTPGRRG
nr:ABC transporter substrate-binding protein [Rhizobium sp. CF080]